MARTTKTGTAPIAPGTGPARPAGPEMPLPHERDEASGQGARKPDPVIEQAHRDIDAGLVDTDMRATPGLDAARRDAMVPVKSVGPGPQPAAPATDRQPTVQRRS